MIFIYFLLIVIDEFLEIAGFWFLNSWSDMTTWSDVTTKGSQKISLIKSRQKRRFYKIFYKLPSTIPGAPFNTETIQQSKATSLIQA